ncbi:MAG: hypothetical protein ABIG60_03225 [Patescibacteria group bacterium]
MSPEKWENVISNIKDNFQVEDEGTENLEDDGGVDLAFITFNGPIGKIRLEYITKPVVLDKKTTYSRRIGSETKVDYVYGEEKTHLLNAYKWDEAQDDWVEIDSGSFDN